MVSRLSEDDVKKEKDQCSFSVMKKFMQGRECKCSKEVMQMVHQRAFILIWDKKFLCVTLTFNSILSHVEKKPMLMEKC